MSKTKLKPCPFCKGEAGVMSKDWCFVFCKECDAEADSYETIAEAIDAWNRRDTETELLEALQELVHEQCQLTCKDHDKECTPTCWVRKHKQLIAKAKGDQTQ